MALKLPLSGHPCASLHCEKCRYMPLSLLYQHRFGSCVFGPSMEPCGLLEFRCGEEEAADFVEHVCDVKRE